MHAVAARQHSIWLPKPSASGCSRPHNKATLLVAGSPLPPHTPSFIVCWRSNPQGFSNTIQGISSRSLVNACTYMCHHSNVCNVIVQGISSKVKQTAAATLGQLLPPEARPGLLPYIRVAGGSTELMPHAGEKTS
jgi:hypothetical protein